MFRREKKTKIKSRRGQCRTVVVQQGKRRAKKSWYKKKSLTTLFNVRDGIFTVEIVIKQIETLCYHDEEEKLWNLFSSTLACPTIAAATRAERQLSCLIKTRRRACMYLAPRSSATCG